jgi:hypothetical protein
MVWLGEMPIISTNLQCNCVDEDTLGATSNCDWQF